MIMGGEEKIGMLLGDKNIKKVTHLKYLGSVMQEDVRLDNKIREQDKKEYFLRWKRTSEKW